MLAFCWNSIGIMLLFSWYLFGILLVFYWYSIGIRLGFYWYSVRDFLQKMMCTEMLMLSLTSCEREGRDRLPSALKAHTCWYDIHDVYT